MEINFAKIKTVIKKYKYAAIILVLGITLMLLPNISSAKKEQPMNVVQKEQSIPDLDKQLSDVLCRIDGAGKVEVMLTIAKGQQTIYQSNTNETNDERSSTSKIDTVILTDSSRNEYGLIKRVDPACYQGAIVLCQGADSPSVRLAIIEAVSKATGLSSAKICVLKMN
jgi:stage III sporulation protein AG